MKAVLIRQFGADDVATLEDVAMRAPRDDEIAVRVMAAGVNPLDLKIIAGWMQPVFPVAFPYIVGTDYAGVVEAVGKDIRGVAPGARVFGRLAPTAGGAFAERAIVPADSFCRMPDDMSFEQGAAISTTVGTAALALLEVGRLQAGQRVLVHAGAGGVGSMAVQIARLAGAHVVATASARNAALVRELGADEVIDYRSTDFATVLSDVDLVLDTLGGETLARSWQVVRPGGAIVSIADHTIAPRGQVSGTFVAFGHSAAVLASIRERVVSGRLQVVIDTIHPLDDARGALEHVASGHARGKVIIRTAG